MSSLKRRTARRLAALCALPLLAMACGTVHERRVPLGELFPNVRGRSLDGAIYQIPEAFEGEPTLLLIGYEQNAQFDIDRWLLGLSQAEVTVKTFELPTIPGLFPGLVAGKIDAGMRSGIPKQDWAAVITIYEDAGKVARFTGNRNGLTGRVVLLDPSGRVAFFHDEGYSVAALMRLKETLDRMQTG